MKVTIKGNVVLAQAEEGDARIRDESDLFHHLKKALNAQGRDLIKKCPEKDGHMFSAPFYLRDRNWDYCIIDNHYALRDSAEEYRKNGKYEFMLIEWEHPQLPLEVKDGR